MHQTGNPSVVVAVLTYKRPQDLGLTLPRLIHEAISTGPHCSVLVIDNDPGASARDMVASFSSAPVKYAHEPRPGIAAARNRALQEAGKDDLLVFIDDDEAPVDNWLKLLLAQYWRSRPTAVAGPVVSEYEQRPSPWIAAGEFFNRRRMASGTPLTVAATNNLLLDLHQVRSLDLHFDERFGLSGGSDTLFTRQLLQRGGTMVWCDEAVVIDRVPVSRLTRSWVLRRALRSGNSWSRVALEIAHGPVARMKARLVLAARGAIRLLGGGARFAGGMATRTPHHQAKGLRTAARGAGMFSGAFGYVYSEYKRSGT